MAWLLLEKAEFFGYQGRWKTFKNWTWTPHKQPLWESRVNAKWNLWLYSFYNIVQPLMYIFLSSKGATDNFLLQISAESIRIWPLGPTVNCWCQHHNILYCSWLKEVVACERWRSGQPSLSHTNTKEVIVVHYSPIYIMDLGFVDSLPGPWFGAKLLPVPWQSGHPPNRWWRPSWRRALVLCSSSRGCDGSAPQSQDHKLCWLE